MKPGDKVGAAFAFFTILPLSGGSLQAAADAGWLLPLVALALGTLEGLAAWGLSFMFAPLVTAALVLALALVMTGFHHADGVADTGDAFMVRGDAARRLAVLKDRTLGVGAAGALILTYLISWSALAETIAALTGPELIAAMIIVEVSARLCLLLVARLTPPSHQGSGSVFLNALKGWRGIAGIALSLAALVPAALMIQWTAFSPVPAVIAAALLISVIARRWFGGAGGDILGASVEWGRMVALLALAASLT
ncbi:MAG TPA: adenosylcobinamide-GDP ribazoletransferase [Actinobacteria bacterium]|nr:adenosylcobinamide-GDP ribazoletransferase [Actinomycetota bacterium]